ncbi:YjdF family protein [[Clostridium] innocuum]|nr:YjdF family protein [[Clostridium] innocuum]
MNQTSLSFTVFFEDPFWIGLFEYREQQLLYLKRIVFGSEPSEQVVYEWLKGCWYSIRFQAPVETVRSKASHRNPKRMQREARKAQDTGLSLTKSQLAVKQQQEERAELKAERRKENREGQKEAFRLRQMKKKAKHKGR